MGAIALPLTVADLVEEYERKVAEADRVVSQFKDAVTALDAAATVQGIYVERVAPRDSVCAEAIRRNLLLSGWRAVYRRLMIDHLASASDKRRFEKDLASPPPLTVENAKATFGDYLIRPRFHILRGLAEVFCALDPAYKSHSRVRIGKKGLPKRVILGNWSSLHGSYGRDRFKDMVNALAAVRGQAPLDWLEVLDIEDQHRAGADAVMNGRPLVRSHFDGREPDEFTAPDRGLTVRKFANGNAHVFFDDAALLSINRGLAEFYGDVLPDAEPEGVKPSASTAVSKDLQFYWSPPEVAEAALDFAGVPTPRDYRGNPPVWRVLEPSCGDGRILDGVRARGHHALGIEYHPGRASEARRKGHAVVCTNFLEQPPAPEFDAVVMNPPFYGRHYLKHVNHALRFLKPGGTLVSILPATARYDHGELQGEWRDLPVASFANAGTNVPTTMIKMRAA